MGFVACRHSIRFDSHETIRLPDWDGSGRSDAPLGACRGRILGGIVPLPTQAVKPILVLILVAPGPDWAGRWAEHWALLVDLCTVGSVGTVFRRSTGLGTAAYSKSSNRKGDAAPV